MIRPLTQADAEPVAALIRTAFATPTAPVAPPPSALRETAGNIASILAQGGGGAAVERDGHIVGACIWQEKAGGLYFGRLSVAATARGQGIARALLAAAEAEARARGLPKLLLSTRLALADNRRLFARHGFVEVATHAHPGYAEPTFVDMEKSLA
jgi:ribosomal protein S18 acetylase RimI-like enzyme